MKKAIISGIAEVKTPNAVMLIEQLREGEEDGKLRGLMAIPVSNWVRGGLILTGLAGCAQAPAAYRVIKNNEKSKPGWQRLILNSLSGESILMD